MSTALSSFSSQAVEVRELWFHDGTIVLRAGALLFCLHGGLLSSRSSIFRRILEGRNDDVELEVTRGIYVTGQPMIILPDDAKDVHNFFLAMLDVVPGFFEPPPYRSTIEVVLGILKMSTKYKIHPLRRRALAHLNTIYPLTLAQWDLRTDMGTIAPQHEAYTSFPFPSTFSCAYAVLKVAKETDAPWILPAAFYECCQFDLEVILAEFVQYKSSMMGPVDDVLHKAIILGATRQAASTRKIFRFLALPPADGCVEPDACLDIRRRFMYDADYVYDSNNPLGIWEDPDMETYLEGMCKPCLDMCWNVHRDARTALWDSLPQMYELTEKWARLKEMHAFELAA